MPDFLLQRAQACRQTSYTRSLEPPPGHCAQARAVPLTSQSPASRKPDSGVTPPTPLKGKYSSSTVSLQDQLQAAQPPLPQRSLVPLLSWP